MNQRGTGSKTSARALESSKDQPAARRSKKRDAFIAAATPILNRRGISGMTMGDVTGSLGLTSIFYYFKNKDELAAACIDQAIARIDALVSQAAASKGREERLKHLVFGYFEMLQAIRQGRQPDLATFSDVRALREPYAAPVAAAYLAMFRRVRSWFEDEESGALGRQGSNARTFLLITLLTWVPAWAHQYDAEDYPHLADRMFDILRNGLRPTATDGVAAALPGFPPQPDSQRASQETFLIAATALINEQGYHGASVDKISARLNVTKGSFYHHHEAKDDLVLLCFRRTFDIMTHAQRAANTLAADGWTRLYAVCRALLDFQLSERGPLLRTTALSALPEGLVGKTIMDFDRIANRFAMQINDGLIDGSLRAVDVRVAAHMVAMTINSAAEVPLWVKESNAADIAAIYLRPMLFGLLVK